MIVTGDPSSLRMTEMTTVSGDIKPSANDVNFIESTEFISKSFSKKGKRRRRDSDSSDDGEAERGRERKRAILFVLLQGKVSHFHLFSFQTRSRGQPWHR